ncbi:hypothetical protein DFH08DRAFT_979744 [Mycena albidolilacea]|uniref:Uncharacterized protein n=1 Tax=Mycena albidolilacea TaxID=1033008 RepID=A0AAD6YW11_9AGAR|nr:hypothetical protein DFH08DRAFT_979744 [Mycena albidolilacea]
MPKAQPSAISERNPLDFVQQPRKRKSKGSTKTLSDATKASRAAAAEARKQSNAALEEEFSQIFTKREEQIAHLSEKYKKPAKYIRQVLENSVHYTGKRAPSIKNAIRHHLSKKARENGESSNVLDVDLKGEEYEEYKDSLSKQERADLIAQLMEYKALKEHGIRATNKAVALDAMQNTNQIGERISNLHARTGVCAFSMFSHGHPDDPAMPCFVDSDNARQFFQDSLDMSVYDLVRKYELWCINQDKPVRQGREKVELCKFISSTVEEALRKATSMKTLKMLWVNYKIDIVHKYGVELVGWPTKVAMVRPSQLRGQDVRLIVERLRNGTMRWIGLTKAQRDEVAAEVEKLRESGAAKPRQERFDKDKPRGPRKKKTAAGDADADDSDNESSNSGDESDKGGDDEDLDGDEPRLPIVSPFVAVQPADRAESPAVPFATAPSPIPTATTNPTPTAPFATAPSPFATAPTPFATAPSPIPTATTSPTPAAPFATAPSPIPTASSSPTNPTPAAPFATAPSPIPTVSSSPTNPTPAAPFATAPSPIPTATPLPTPAPALPFASASASDAFVQNPTPASVLGEAPLFLPLYEDGFTLDFDDMDLTMVPYVTQPDSSANNFSSTNWHLNMSNRDEEWTDASGVNGSTPNTALRASGGTGLDTGLFGGAPYAQGFPKGAPYMQEHLQGTPYAQGNALSAQGNVHNAHNAQGNLYANAPLHNSYPAAAGPFMSVFSVATNTTTTKKRKRADGDAGEKVEKRAPKKKVMEGEGATGKARASKRRPATAA